MINKLIVFNFVIVIMMFGATIGVFYGINYPINFDITSDFRDYGFEYTAVVISFVALVTALISTLRIKNYDFKNKFFRILPVLNSLFLFFLIYLGISGFEEQRSDYLKIEAEYISQAKLDIKNDNITYKYSGGFSLPECKQNIDQKIDSISKLYGVKYSNSGCVILNGHMKAEEKYAEMVKPYLDKRNGKNWEEKMQSEIQNVKRDCR